jgi:hypothetical protein
MFDIFKCLIDCSCILAFARSCFPNTGLALKKMKDDIAGNIRQGRFYSKPKKNVASDHTEASASSQSEDEEDIVDEEDVPVNSRSFSRKNYLIESSSDDEE